ncbi:hypothetical protein ACNKHU_20575 [Shigella flexneri]
MCLHFGSYHDVDSSELAFKLAALSPLKKALKKRNHFCSSRS